MFFYHNKEHKLPHIYVECQNETAVIEIPNGEILTGSLPNAKLKLVQAWVEIHQEALMADWKLAVEGSTIFKIEGLK